jgi:hypothetical protein
MKVLSKIIALLLIITGVLAFIACTSISAKAEVLQTQKTENSKDTGKYPDPVLVDGVINFTDPIYSFLLDTSPDSGTLLFFSFVPRREYREDEIKLAVFESSRQAAMLSSSKVNAKFAVKSNNRDLGVLESIEVQYDRGMAEDLISKVKIIQHFRDNDGTYILSELEGITFQGNFSSAASKRTEPDWLYIVPVIQGYLVSIGTVQRSRYKIDSIRKADEQALANLAKQVSVEVKAKRADLESEASGSAFSETNYEVTSTYIRGFYVLGRWSTDNGSTYHTLAVCPENQ